MPHAERANTASFLEEVITYIQGLQKRISELEQGKVTHQAPTTQAAPASTGINLGLYVASGGAPASLQPQPAQVSPSTVDPWPPREKCTGCFNPLSAHVICAGVPP